MQLSTRYRSCKVEGEVMEVARCCCCGIEGEDEVKEEVLSTRVGVERWRKLWKSLRDVVESEGKQFTLV